MGFGTFGKTDSGEQGMSKLYKWLAIILGALFIVVLAVVLFVRFYFTAELITSLVSPPLEHYLHRDVTIADAKVGFRGFRVEGLEIRKQGASAPFLKGERLELRWKFTALLTGRVEIHTLVFTNPEFTIIRLEDGALSIADLLPETTSAENNTESVKTASDDYGGVPLIISLLSIKNGSLTYADYSRQPQATLKVRNIQSRFVDFSAAAPIPFEITGQIEGLDQGSFAASGTYDLAKSALESEVSLQKIDLASLAPLIEPDHAALIQQGKLSLEAALAAEKLDHFKGKGTLNLSGLKIKTDEKLSKAIQLDADFQLDAVRSRQNLEIAALDLILNGQRAEIQGTLTQWHQKPHLEFTLNSPQIKLDELLALLPKIPPSTETTEGDSKQSPMKNELSAEKEEQETNAESPSSPASDQPGKQSTETADSSQTKPAKDDSATDQKENKPPVPAKSVASSPEQPASTGGEPEPKSIAFDARGNIHLDWFFYNKLVVSNVDCQLTFRDGKLQLEPLSASLYGGALGGGVKGDILSTGPPFQSRVYLENIILDEIIAAFWPDTAGHWSGNVNLISRASGNGSDLSALQSRIDLNINAAEFSGHPLFLKFAELFQAEGLQQLRFSQVTARILTKQGVATIKRIHLVGPIVQAEGTGTAGLLDNKLDLHLLLQIRAQYVGKIAPLRDIVTKIADKQGFVQLPITIGGTLDEPVYGLDQRWLKKTAKRLGVQQVKQVKKVETKKPAKPPQSQRKQQQLKEELEKLVQ